MMTRLRAWSRRADRSPICCAVALAGLWIVSFYGLMFFAAMVGIE